MKYKFSHLSTCILCLLSTLSILDADTFYDEIEIRQDYTSLKSSNPNEQISKTFGKSSISYMMAYNNEYISIDLDGELYNLNQDEPTIQKNVSLQINQNKIYTVRSALLGIKLSEEFTWYTGVIPFRGGKFSSIKTSKNNTGNGIELLTDQVFVGSFIAFNKNNFNLQIGHVELVEKLNYLGLSPKNDGSNGEYLILTYTKNNHYIEFNYFNAAAYMGGDTENQFKFADYNLYGLGYIFCDSAQSGFTYWLEGSYSDGKEDLDSIAKDSVDQNILPFLPNLGYLTGINKNQGGSVKTGIAYSNEFEWIEYKIGIEYYKSFRGNFTMNHGVIFQSNYSYWQHKMAEQYTIFANLRLNANTFLDINYAISHNPEIPYYFSPTESIDWENSNSKDTGYTKHQRLSVSISYRF